TRSADTTLGPTYLRALPQGGTPPHSTQDETSTNAEPLPPSAPPRAIHAIQAPLPQPPCRPASPRIRGGTAPAAGPTDQASRQAPAAPRRRPGSAAQPPARRRILHPRKHALPPPSDLRRSALRLHTAAPVPRTQRIEFFLACPNGFLLVASAVCVW